MREQDIILIQAKANLDAVPMVFAMTLDLAGYHHLHERINCLVHSAMKMTNAELGLLYLQKDHGLELATTLVDDSLHNLARHKFFYEKMIAPVNDDSPAGSSAGQRKILLLKNVREIPPWVQSSPLREKIHTTTPYSMLCVPLLDEFQEVLGVLQLLNGKNSLFFAEQGSCLEVLQAAAGRALAQGMHEHHTMMRALGMVQLHDPRETLGHVSRMGAMAAEIYQALHPDEPENQVVKYRDYMRVATMYHDVGKVAVSGDVLQKHGPLDLREFMQVQSHSIKGAGLFIGDDSELARICREVILNHHEHWDGTGYPGHLDAAVGANGILDQGKRGEEIPQSARITHLVDAYDNMTRPDIGAWPEEEALNQIRQSRHFDPRVVEAFFQVYDVIQAIKKFYSDE